MNSPLFPPSSLRTLTDFASLNLSVHPTWQYGLNLTLAGTISDPATFLSSISRTRRDLASNSSLTSAIGDKWSNIFTIQSSQLKEAGVTTQDRRFFLWAREKFRQGANPEVFVIDAKPKKKVRGWGARVQTAERIRVRGVRRPGEK